MFAFLIAAPAAMPSLSAPVAAELKNYAQVYTTDDFPEWFLRQAAISVMISARTIIAPDGRLESCIIENPARDPRMGSLTCALMTKRGKFLPARWIDGSPAIGVSRFPIGWTADKEMPRTADIDVSVSRMPHKTSKEQFVDVAMAVDTDGAIKGCSARSSIFFSRKPKQLDATLARLACDSAQNWKPVPMINSSGNSSRTVQTLVVRFSAK